MAFIQGEGRSQGTLFPVTLDELIPEDHVCRVIDAFVGRLDVAGLGFERAEAAETGRPGYDPRDLLKLYLYGYLQQIRSARRLELECQRNVELMWLLGRLCPDHKSIAEFRRVHSDAVTEAGAELIRFARSVGLVRGEWVAIDGSKFRAVSSARSVREREALKRYLDELESADAQDEVVIDPSAVAAALEKLKKHSEPEAGFMRTGDGTAPAYNVQTAVDAEHALIVVQKVTRESNDTRSLQPMAEAAKMDQAGLQGIDQRATSEIMRLRRSTVQHPFATLKYRIFGHPRVLLRGLRGAQTEMSLAVMAYNIKRMFNILGGLQLKTSFSIV